MKEKYHYNTNVIIIILILKLTDSVSLENNQLFF